MRNWNYNTLNKNYQTIMVYRLPMRNWNKSSPPTGLGVPQVYRLPMRNWNQSLLSQSLSLGRTFIDYLWGIEIASPDALRCDTHYVYRLPMRNWNFFVCDDWSVLVNVYRLPMRNWNTIPASSTIHTSFSVYRLPMRNWNSQIRGTSSGFTISFIDYLWGIEIPHRGLGQDRRSLRL